MGKVTVTIQNLDVVRVDMDKNVILVKGSVPGPKGAILKVKSAVKASKQKGKEEIRSCQKQTYMILKVKSK